MQNQRKKLSSKSYSPFPLLLFPLEIIILIITFISDPKTFKNISITSKLLYEICSNPEILKTAKDQMKKKIWLDEAIRDEHINLYEYNDFKILEKIGSGGSGKVYKAIFKNNVTFALKSYKYDAINITNIKQSINEVRCKHLLVVNEIIFFLLTRIDLIS